MADDGGTGLSRDRTWYDRLAPVYGLFDGLEAGPRRAGAQALALRPGERVLEIGCGPGAGLVDLARAVLPGGHVTGVDLSAAMVERARRRVLAQGLTGVADLVQADARRLPFAAGVFDAAFASFTLELFAAAGMARVAKELARVLVPGGRVVVVALAAGPSIGVRGYAALHRLLPSVVDCRPIDAAATLVAAGCASTAEHRLSVWGLPVTVAAASAPASAGV